MNDMHAYHLAKQIENLQKKLALLEKRLELLEVPVIPKKRGRPPKHA